MDQEKLKILQMIENGRINSYEAMELLSVLSEDNDGVNLNISRVRRKGKKLKIEIISDDKKRDIVIDVNEIFVSAVMNRINTELKYNGINLSTDDLKLVKDKIMSGRKMKLEKEQGMISLYID